MFKGTQNTHPQIGQLLSKQAESLNAFTAQVQHTHAEHGMVI
jgi:hypothetical protein